MGEFSEIPMGLLALVPGWIWLAVERRLRPDRRSQWQEELFRCGIYSLALTFMIGILASAWKMVPWSLSVPASLSDVVLGLCCVALAVLGGISTASMARGDAVGQGLRLIGLNPGPREETAWRSAFCRDEGCLVELCFGDGKVEYATFGDQSLVSSSEREGDAFFEQRWIDHGEYIEPDPVSLGFWIQMEQVRWIRFHDLNRFQEGLNSESEQQSSRRDGLLPKQRRQGRGRATKQARAHRQGANTKAGAVAITEEPEIDQRKING